MILELSIEMMDWMPLLPLMGIFGIGGSKSSSKTSSVTQADLLELIKGVFSDTDPQVRDLAQETLQNVRGAESGVAPEVTGGVGGFDFNQRLEGSEIGRRLKRSLLDPSFSPETEGEQSLINSTRDQILGSTALKGLKPTVGGITQGLAPILAKLRQTRIGNLSDAFKAEVGGTLTGRGQDVSQRGQDVTQRGQTIGGEQAQLDSELNSFLSLLSLGRQTPVVRGGGTVSKGKSDSFSLGLKF